jgi:hypothetical protein
MKKGVPRCPKEGLYAHRLAPGTQDERREDTVGVLKEAEVGYKKVACYRHMTGAMPENVV